MRRRTLLLSGAAAAGAGLIGWGVMPPRSRLGQAEAAGGSGESIGLNGWLKITPDGRVQLAMPRCEIGQGIHTALSMLVAEELEVPVQHITCVSAGMDAIYGNLGVWLAPLPWQAPASGTEVPPEDGHRLRLGRWLLHKAGREWGLQLTTGSCSVIDAWDDLRMVAATARAQLLRAASLRWHQPVDELTASQGIVRHASGEQAHYGELAAVAALTRPPGEVRLKPRQQWAVIGRPMASPGPQTPGLRLPQFGMDWRAPDLLYASVRHAPTLGGGVGTLALDEVWRMPGVERVVRLGTWAGATAGVAVVARSTWHARRAAQALRGEWHPPAQGTVDSEQCIASLQAQALLAAEAEGVDVRGSDVPQQHQAVYAWPYLAHLPLEPTHATAQVREDQVSVWAPTQSPTAARALAAQVAGVPEAKVVLNVTPAGGSFGRRMDIEVIGQAVRVALETQGRPVQLVWSPADEVAHDFYRPAGAAVLQATLDGEGWPVRWYFYGAGDAVTPRWLARQWPQRVARLNMPDGHMGEGQPTLPYRVPHAVAQQVATDSGVPVGHWRSGAHAGFAWASECFIDELAHRGGHDPVHYRRQLLMEQPAISAVLDAVAERAQWSRPLPAGVGRGVALNVCAHSIVAMVAEVRSQQGRVHVLRVVCAADVGTVVHPAGVTQQLEGGILYGLNAALWGQVDVRNSQARLQAGRPRWLTMAQVPQIITHVMRSDRAPGGVGGIATPVIAPAVANAWFKLTGERVRRLPLWPRTG